MTKKKVLFLTGAYPFYPGEQFIEDEITYWADQTIADVCIAPASAQGMPRSLPQNISLDLGLTSSSKLYKLIFIVAALWSPIFWREIPYILKNHGLCFKCLFNALKSTSFVLYLKNKLKKVIKKTNNIDIAYCYWNDVQAYAAIILKNENLIKKVVSRAHGFDVYENRRSNNYMPLKRQFINDFDYILAIADQGKKYLEETYNASHNNILVSRLGVPIGNVYAKHTDNNKLNLLSISFCVPIKRIDKIIDALLLFKSKAPDIDINWTHIGGGPLLEVLSALAQDKLAKNGIQYKFTGTMANADVKKYFELNEVDLFINASESEGVPVSIMEAMSYGVPTIAPDVGGVSEIVSNEDGWLMSDAPVALEISNAIFQLKSKAKDIEFRKKVKQKIITHYDAKKNYRDLVNLVAAD